MKPKFKEKLKLLEEGFKHSECSSITEYIKMESESDPGFFRWFFNKDFKDDFDRSLTDIQKNEFEKFINSVELTEKMQKYIVVYQNEQPYITNRSNFKEQNLCDCYGNYGQKIGCYNASCHSKENHTKVKAWTYFDGSNFRSLFLKCEFDSAFELKEANEEEERKILAEFDESKLYLSKNEATGNYHTISENYTFSSYPGSFWLARVDYN